MGTRKVLLTGIGYWMRVFEQNRDLTGFEDALKDIGGQCVMDMDLDASEYAKLKSAKFMSNGKPSADNPGYTRVKLKRKWTESYGGGAPVVLKADGTAWDYDVDGPIGNGSKVAVIVHVYDTKAKNIFGARLEKIKVLEHIPYIKDDFAEAEEPEAAPAPQAKASTPKTARKVELADDDIPF